MEAHMYEEDDELEGGDAACWAHMLDPDDAETTAGNPTPGIASLTSLAEAARRSGPAWTGASDDLNVNLLVFSAGDGVAEHVNSEVDVLMIGIAGEGTLVLDGTERAFRTGDAVLVPKGSRRGTRAESAHFAYLTCHRRRGGLWPTRR
jgi:quercetin dioxygenase-like cupin family protein